MYKLQDSVWKRQLIARGRGGCRTERASASDDTLTLLRTGLRR